MKNLLMLVIASLLLTMSSAASEWVPLRRTRGPASAAPVDLGVRLADGEFMVRLDLPGFYRTRGTVDSVEYSIMELPGASAIMEKGAPDLPKVTSFVPIPQGAIITGIEVFENDGVPVEMEEEIMPSRGHLTRGTNPEDVPLVRGSEYEELWPPSLVEVEEPFDFGAIRAVRVEVRPFRYDGRSRNLMAYPDLRFRVNYESDRNTFLGEGPVTKEFLELYRGVFGAQYADIIDQEIRDIPPEAGHLLIVCHDDFVDVMEPFVEWKIKSGIHVQMITRNQIAPNATANQIYDYVRSVYRAGRLTHLLLVGDPDHIPFLLGKFEHAPSDARYVIFGQGNVPDAFHSRISAKNVQEVQTQINKFLYYEMYPPQGSNAAWLTRATGIASDEGNPCDRVRANWLRDALLGSHYTHVDQIYDPAASAAAVVEAVNQGRGMINYIGHGTETAWVTTWFANRHIRQELNNSGMWPMIWSVACVNGDYTWRWDDCFAEVWMNAGTPDDPYGAIGVLASTTDEAWIPPCDMQKEINIVHIAGERTFSLGALTMAGMLKAFEIWGSSDYSRGNQLNEQNVLFSDSTLLLRNNIPKVARVSTMASGSQVTFHVSSMTPYVRVSMYNQDLTQMVTGVVGNNGRLTLNIPAGLSTHDLRYTVYGKDLVPLIDQTL